MVRALCFAPLAALAVAQGPEGRVDFAREIRPVFESRCYECHAIEKPKGGFRIDRRALALAGSRFGKFKVILPGDGERSPLYQRLVAENPKERMPQTGDPLSPETIERIRLWIDQGAEWPEDADDAAPPPKKHWAYEKPERPPLPSVRDASWVRNPIDLFVLERLEREGLRPTTEADRATLIRRASLDLTGLPPTIEEVDAFVEDGDPEAYGKVVDRLLASPHYGERQALFWLDLARYADTHGYEKDARRAQWRWRDWVIEAFRRDLPFDRFTIEQIAGDLLPGATIEQKIATGLHRNTMINEEGGTDPEEFRHAAVVDRVNTTATVWLGTTLSCAQCHDHKYDPFSQEEYWRFFAYFNSTADTGNARAPEIETPTNAQAREMAKLRAEIGRLRDVLAKPQAEMDEAQRAWEETTRANLPPEIRWRTLVPDSLASKNGTELVPLSDGSVLARGENPAKEVYEATFGPGSARIRAFRLEALTDPSLPHGGTGRAYNANFVLGRFEAWVSQGAGEETRAPFVAAEADHEQGDGPFRASMAIDDDPGTGWAAEGHRRREGREIVFLAESAIELEEGARLRVTFGQESRYAQHNIGRFRLSVTEDDEVARRLAPLAMSPWSLAGPFHADSHEKARETAFAPEREALEGGAAEAAATLWTERPHWRDGAVVRLEGESCATYLRRTIRCEEPTPVEFFFGSDDALRVWLGGELLVSSDEPRGVAPDQHRVERPLSAGESTLLLKVVNYAGEYGFFFDARRAARDRIPALVERALRLADFERTDAQRESLREFYRRNVSDVGRSLHARLAEFEKRRKSLDDSIARTMVMEEMAEPRTSHFHPRGNFLLKGRPVERGVPAVLNGTAVEGPRDRLGLARWLVSTENPLTARVVVNRHWEQLFGRGLVSTSEDFGTRGEPPSHPELLDWLASEFAANGWSVKGLLRTIITSATYRQGSRVAPELLERDPDNALLSRVPRLRLEAETLRDVALAASGLLNPEIGGPSVFPPQPDGIWASARSDDKWVAATDESRHRRGLYTFARRTAPYATFSLFDAPSREFTCTRRPRTNTPLQALALLNDPAFVEAAEALAGRMAREGGSTDEERAAYGFRLCVARQPTPEEVAVLLDLCRSLGDGAGWTAVANVLLNLDETVTKG